MVLFNKVGIDLLQELLGQVKGGVYIHETSYEKKTKQLLIAYGTIANSENQVAPFSGISIKVRVISDEELNSVSTMENIKLNGQEIAAPQNIVQLFWTIVSEVSTELESRVQKILSKPQKSAIVVKAVDIVNPFTIDSRSASVRVELMIGEFRYQEELPAFQVFYLGSKGLFNYLILRCLQFLCMRTFEANGKNYIKIPQKAFFNCIPKFMQALSEVGMLEVLLEDEAAISAKLEELQKKILGYVKKDSLEAGLEKNYLISEADDEFLISGLELAFVAYLLLGTPSRIPITILTWVLDELSDTVIKDRLKEVDLEFFYGEEEKLFKGLVEDQSEEELYASVNKGFYSNLFEMDVEAPVLQFKKNVQKSLLKYDLGGLKERKFKKSDGKKKNKPKEKNAGANEKVEEVLTKPFALFPAFDSAEQELRTREFAKEITICIVSESEDEIDQNKLVLVSQNVMQAIRDFSSQQIIYLFGRWVYFQPGAEDQLQDADYKNVYKQILKWGKIRERLIRKRWGLSDEYDLISYDDIFSVLKKDNFTNVITELDHLFAIKQLFVRKSKKGLETWKKKKQAKVQQILTLQMLEPLVENPIKRKKISFFGWRLGIHRWLKKMQGRIVLHGDLLRNIDFLDDILFIYNSRFGLEIPNSILIDEIMTELQGMESDGILKRYLLGQHAVTSIPIKVADSMSEKRSLLIQMITAIIDRYPT